MQKAGGGRKDLKIRKTTRNITEGDMERYQHPEQGVFDSDDILGQKILHCRQLSWALRVNGISLG